MFNTSHLHPMLVHFPIVLILSGIIIEVLFFFKKNETYLPKAGFILMVIGTLSAWIAFASGHLFTNEPQEGEIANIFFKHESGALITVIVMSLGLFLRTYLIFSHNQESKLSWVVLAFYFIGLVTVTYTGFMGGTMVYDYMIGV